MAEISVWNLHPLRGVSLPDITWDCFNWKSAVIYQRIRLNSSFIFAMGVSFFLCGKLPREVNRRSGNRWRSFPQMKIFSSCPNYPPFFNESTADPSEFASKRKCSFGGRLIPSQLVTISYSKLSILSSGAYRSILYKRSRRGCSRCGRA